MDGTLADSAVSIQTIINQVLEQEGKDPLPIEVVIRFIGNGISTFIERTQVARDIPASEHARLFNLYNELDARSNVVTNAYPDVIQTLQLLSDTNYALGLCTNKLTKATHVMLEKMQLDNFLQTIVCGDTLDTRKPDPAMLHNAFDNLPDALNVYVGDSEVDAETAERARVPFLLFTEGYRKTPIDQIPHTYAFSSYKELPNLLGKLLQA